MRITKLQVAMLKDALSSARLERYASRETVSDGMRLYLETWVASRIEEVIEAVEATA
jgi:hypothetical protein